MSDDIEETVERRTAGRTVVYPAGYDIAGIDFEKSEEEIEFEKFFEEMAESNEYAKICVYRVPINSETGRPTSRKLAFLFEIGVTEMTYSQLCSKIRDDYGTGTYRLQMRGADGAMKKMRTIAVEAPKAAQDSPTAPSNNVIAAVADALNRQAEQQRELFERFHTRPAFDFDKILGYVVPIATALGALGISFKRKPDKSLVETLQELATVKSLFDNGGDEKESNIFSLLEKTVVGFAPAFAQAVAAGRERGDVDERGMVRPALEAPQRGGDAMRPNGVDAEVMAIKPQLEFILMQARLNNEPKTVADFILDNIADNDQISDDQLERIYTFLGMHDCYERVAVTVPGFAKYPDWFEAWRVVMVEGVAELLRPDDENETLTDGATGGHSMPHAGTAANQGAGHPNGNSRRGGGNKSDVADHAQDGAGMEKVPESPPTDP